MTRRGSWASSLRRSPSRRSRGCGSGLLSAFRTGTLRWRALLPGALLVAVGFQVLHALVVNFLVPKLEKSTSLYGGLGAVTTLLLFMYFVGRLVVTAPVLNSSLHHELREQADNAPDDGTTGPAGASPG